MEQTLPSYRGPSPLR